MAHETHVVVVGGGYAGVVAANRLSTGPGIAVSVVNPRSVFVERIRLHQRAAGTYDAAAHDLTEVLAPGVRLVVDAARRIDTAARVVELCGGANLRYDYLVIAAGSHAARSTVPGAAEHAVALSTLEQAEALGRALAATARPAPLVVVGGGATGIETAAELAEAGRPVTLVASGEAGAFLHPRAREEVRRGLDRLGVTRVEGLTVTAVDATGVRLSDGRTLPSAGTVWTAGFGVPDLTARSGLPTDTTGRLLTDETLTSLGDERVLGAGDAVAPSALPYRMCCAAAMPLGVHAADTVLRRVAGHEPRPFAVPVAGICLSLGRRRGVLQLSRRDDTPTPVHVGGVAGARLKESISAGTLAALRLTSRRPGLLTALGVVQDPSRADRLAQARATAVGALTH